ncbi:MAG: carboxypeptidase regulatory-like domain-containing protein, partial [Cytophagaceae bacterium]
PNTITDEDGRFSIGPLFPSIYDVRFHLPHPELFLVPMVSGVQVSKGEVKELAESRAIVGTVVSGVVLDEQDGTPVERVSLSVEGGGEYQSVRTDAKGNFSVRCLPGTSSFSISWAPSGYVHSQQKSDVVVGNEAPAPLEFKVKKVGVVRGIMVDETGKPIRASVRRSSSFEIQSDDDGKWQILPSYLGPHDDMIALASNEGEDAFYELISPVNLDMKETGEITIKVRKRPWLVMSARALKTDGTPLEGASIVAHFSPSTTTGERSTIYPRPRTAVSKANGEFTFTRIPSVHDSGPLSISASRPGYAFRSGGKVSKNGPVWQVSNLVFVPTNRNISGTTESEARVVAGGQEIVADANGLFAFNNLEEDEVLVYAAKGDKFGGGIIKEPFKIELTRALSQGVDTDLARQGWASIMREVTGKNYRMSPWVEARVMGNEPQVVQLEKVQGHGDQVILALLNAWNWRADKALLMRACDLIKVPDLRLNAYISCAIQNNDSALGRAAIQLAEVTFATPASPFIERENNLYAVVPLAARFGGETAGFAALDRAVNFTFKNHGSKSRSPTGWTLDEFARDSIFVIKAPVVAKAGLPLLRRLLSYIEAEPSSGAHGRAFSYSIPILAKYYGLETALPLLDEMAQLPENIQPANRDGLTPFYGTKADAYD